MVSIKPKWCKLIDSGKKTIEVRKTAPKEVPFKAYIYCTKSGGYILPYDDLSDFYNGKVIGEFICYRIDAICPDVFVVREDAERALEGSCISVNEFKKYMKCVPGTPLYVLKDAYAWHISDLVIYDKPKELSEFHSGRSVYEIKAGKLSYTGIKRPPQSWMYVEVAE
ncbi:MAG: hypothetical protein KBS75_09265 [Bacteroidales bacterium]|nr:hypothetical protein [Candidatus Equimonas faecalis]